LQKTKCVPPSANSFVFCSSTKERTPLMLNAPGLLTQTRL
jgi:hypothetical protein